MINASVMLRGGFTWKTLQKRSSSSMSKLRAVECIFLKSCASVSYKEENSDWFKCSCRKLLTRDNNELLDSLLAKAIIIPLVINFEWLSTRVTEFLQLQLDCRFEIQIYNRTQKIRKFSESSISNIQCSGSEPVLSQGIVYLYCKQ